MTRTLLKFIIPGVLLFLSGPAWSGSEYRGDKEKNDARVSVDDKVNRMTKHLGLTAEQQSAIRGILEEKKTKMDNLMEQKRSLTEETREKIKAVLSDEQKAKYDGMKKGKRPEKRGNR